MSFVTILPSPDHNASALVLGTRPVAVDAATRSCRADLMPPQNRKQGATREEWERHRPVIKRMYIDECRTLDEVMSIMETEHNLMATKKMYKARITKWRLNKNNKEHEIAFVLRKKTDRDAIGKATAFRIRGRSIPIEEVRRYCRRKGKNVARLSIDQSTPSDISYWTPATSPSPALSTHDEEHVPSLMPHHKPANGSPLGPWDFRASGELLLIPPTCSTIPQVIAPPQPLLIPEKLFASIHSYIRFNLNNRNWITDKKGKLIHVQNDRTTQLDPASITAHCQTAAHFFKRGLNIKGRQAMSMALQIVKGVLLADSPMALGCFLGSFMDLTKDGFPEMASELRRYIGQMAATILPSHHPLCQLCRMIGLSAMDNSNFLFGQSYCCMADAFGQELGILHRKTIVSRTDAILQSVADGDPHTAVKQVQELLSYCKNLCGSSDWRSQYVMLTLGWLYLHQNEYVEAEAFGITALQLASDLDDYYMVVSRLELVGYSQYCQGNMDGAERCIRESIDLLGMAFGMAEPYRLNRMIDMKDWLVEWGRHEEADQLSAEIEKLLGLNLIDVM